MVFAERGLSEVLEKVEVVLHDGVQFEGRTVFIDSEVVEVLIGLLCELDSECWTAFGGICVRGVFRAGVRGRRNGVCGSLFRRRFRKSSISSNCHSAPKSKSEARIWNLSGF